MSTRSANREELIGLAAVRAEECVPRAPRTCSSVGRTTVCGRGVAREEAAAVLERCDALVARLGPATDCLVWSSLARKLAALLPPNNYIFAQVINFVVAGYNG